MECGLLSNWQIKIVVTVNLVLVILSIVSYVLTINSLVFWTRKADAAGNVGGILDYRWLGVSTVFHLGSQGLEAVYSFLDVTSYLILAIIVFNVSTLLLSFGRYQMTPNWVKIRNLTILNAIVAGLGWMAYAWLTMMRIDSALKSTQLSGASGFDGGVVDYIFPFAIIVYNVFEGHFQSSVILGYFLDVTFWLLPMIAVLSLTAMSLKSDRKPDVTRYAKTKLP